MNPSSSWRIWRIFLLLLIVLAWGARVLIVPKRHFDPDEFQHLHTAYCIAQGLLPYRDFYEHHTPWLAYLLSWIHPLWGASTTTIFAARYLMLVFAAGIVYLTYLVGKQLYDADVALIGALLLSCTLTFLEKTLEVRPDVPETLCLLTGLYTAIRATRSEGGRWYLGSGLALGCAFMFTQKAAFAILGIVIVLAWTWIDRRGRRSWKDAALFGMGLAAPSLLTILFFAARGGIASFVEFNFLMNARWKARFWPFVFFRQILEQDPFVFVLGFGAWIVALPRVFRAGQADRAPALVLATVSTVLVGLFVIPVPFLQSFQPLLPLACILAAGLIWRLTEAPSRRALGGLLLVAASLGVSWTLGRSFVGGSMATHLCMWGALVLAMPPAWLPRGWQRALAVAVVFGAAFLFTPLRTLQLAFLAPALALAATSCVLRPRAQVLSLLLVGMLAFPFQEMGRQSRKATNRALLREIAYVLESTAPDAAVLTGWHGSGVFRPHAYFYPFLHAEVQLMLTEAQLGADVVDALERVQPELVEYDRAVRALGPVVQGYVRRRYQRTGVGVLWRRRPVDDR